jgi:hypothetical protein
VIAQGFPLLSDTLRVPWGWLLEEARPNVREDVDPWMLYRIDLAGELLDDRLPNGPAIYAAVGHGVVQYVGKTNRGMNARLTEHSRAGRRAFDYAKLTSWKGVLVVPLIAGISGAALSQLEIAGRDYLRPRTGSKWG